MSGSFVGVLSHLYADAALGRLGTPEEIAEVVGFLASNAARWITGQIVTVSGGYQ